MSQQEANHLRGSHKLDPRNYILNNTVCLHFSVLELVFLLFCLRGEELHLTQVGQWIHNSVYGRSAHSEEQEKTQGLAL